MQKNLQYLAAIYFGNLDQITPAERGRTGAAGRIMGGASYKLSAVLRLIYASGSTCSAILISPSVFLTARHCVCKRTVGPGGQTSSESPIGASLMPASNVSDANPPMQTLPLKGDYGEYYSITSMSTDPCNTSAMPADGHYDYVSNIAQGYDWIIGILGSPVPIGVARPIPIAARSMTSAAHLAIISGYGETRSGDIKSIVPSGSPPLAAVVALGGPAACRDCVGPEILAVGNISPSSATPVPIAANTDTCEGDSGGPLLLMNAERVQTTQLQPQKPDLAQLLSDLDASNIVIGGITSRGSGQLLCGSGGIYETFAPEAVTWLTTQITKFGQTALSVPEAFKPY